MADTKLADLTAATTLSAGDLLYAVRDPAGTPVDRKITAANVAAALAALIGTYAAVKSTQYAFPTTKTTTSTSFVDMDATNLPALSVTCVTGQIVELELSLSVRNTSDGNVVAFDWLIDRPTSADTSIRAATGADDAGHFTQASASYDHMTLIAVEFTITENGVHTFKPQWRVGSGTASIRGVDDANYSAPVLHRIRVRNP